MPAYRYLLCDLLTDQPLAELPLRGVTFDRRLCRTGSLQGTLDATTPALVETVRTMKANTGKAALWVLRDGVLWWGGVLWTCQVSQGDRDSVTASVSAATFDSYAHRRILRADKTYTQVDDGLIVADLWRWLQSDPMGNIGVEAPDQPTGKLRDRTYLATDQSYVGKLVEDLGDVIDGPEHTIDVYLDGDGIRRKRLRVGKNLGGTEAQIVLQRSARESGSVLSWSDSTDATTGGTVFQTRGDAPNANAGEDAPPSLSRVVYRYDLLAQGFPLLDVTEDRPGVTQQDTLDGHADALAAELGGGVSTRGYTVQVGASGWNPNRVGEPVRIKLRDAWHTNSDVTVRPVGCSVQAAERGQPETITLMFGDE